MCAAVQIGGGVAMIIIDCDRDNNNNNNKNNGKTSLQTSSRWELVGSLVR